MGSIRHLPKIEYENGKWVHQGDFIPYGCVVDWNANRGKTGKVYVIEACGFYKIGISKNLQHRFNVIDCGIPVPIRLVMSRSVPLVAMTYAEAWLHHRYADRRIKGEWFDVPESEIRADFPLMIRRARAYQRLTVQYLDREEGRIAEWGKREFARLEAEA